MKKYNLLIREIDNGILVIDANDPSGMQNKMNEEDLEQLVQYINQQ